MCESGSVALLVPGSHPAPSQTGAGVEPRGQRGGYFQAPQVTGRLQFHSLRMEVPVTWLVPPAVVLGAQRLAAFLGSSSPSSSRLPCQARASGPSDLSSLGFSHLLSHHCLGLPLLCSRAPVTTLGPPPNPGWSPHWQRCR